MNTHSVWHNASRTQFKAFDETDQDIYEVAVVGGGISGLTAALLLKQAGVSVCVLERDHIGAGDTGFTSAHLAYVTDTRLKDLVNRFGKDKARRTWEAGQAAIDTIEQLVTAHEIQCNFQHVPGYLHAAPESSQQDIRKLEDEAQLATELGFQADFQHSVPVVERPGICYARQGRIHPLDYISGLAQAVNGDGSAVFERSEVLTVQEDPLRVIVNGRPIHASYLVLMTHVPIIGLRGLLGATLFQSKLAAYSSYVVQARTSQMLKDAVFWDTSDPYRYLRIDAESSGANLIIGGEDHKTGQESDPEGRYSHLRGQLQAIISDCQFEYRWSGQVIETLDGLPYIGEIAEQQFIATGFGGNGLTFGTVAGIMARDCVLGQQSPWKDVFAPDRWSARDIVDYISENSDFPKYLAAGWLTPAEHADVDSIRSGEGKIISLGGKRAACSRDKHGELHAVSAVCTHMGCVVNWNSAERTWDCPCHGSRFHQDGSVLAGPAEKALQPIHQAAVSEAAG